MTTVIWHIVTAFLTALFLALFYNRILIPKCSKLPTLIVYAIIRTVVTCCSFYIDALVPFRMFTNIGIDLILVFLMYKGKIIKIFFMFFVTFVTMITIDYVTFFLIQAMPSLDESIKYYISDMIFLTGEYFVLLFISNYISCVTVLDDKKTFAAFILIPISQAAMLFMLSYTIITTLVTKTPDGGVFTFKGSSSFALTLVAVSAISMAADFVFMRIAYKASISRQERNQLEVLEKESQINLAYYSELQANADEMRKYRHDVNNIIQTIYVLMNSPDRQASENIEKTLKSLENELNAIRLKKYCSNNLINSIIAINEKRFSAKGIACDIKAAIPERVGIPELDLCRLFTNILDNAFNAMSSEAAGSQSLTLEAHISDGYLYINESNTCPAVEAPVKPGHGLGLKIMREIAEKHNGYFKTQSIDGHFSLQIAVKESTASPLETSAAVQSV